MTLNTINSRLTDDGQVRLSNLEFGYLQDLSAAGDRGAFHYLYSEMANNEDARTTAKIATFSDTVGGIAFSANWILQQSYSTSFPGIYNVSQQIAEDLLQNILINKDSPQETGYLTYGEHFHSAEETWDSFGVLPLFPGNLISIFTDNFDTSWVDEVLDLPTFLSGGGSPGQYAAFLATYYSGHTGKRLSDFQGQPGYTILETNGGSIVLDAQGRTTAVFVGAMLNDIGAQKINQFLSGIDFITQIGLPQPGKLEPAILYAMMGNVGSPTVVGDPASIIYEEARRDFTQYKGRCSANSETTLDCGGTARSLAQSCHDVGG